VNKTKSAGRNVNILRDDLKHSKSCVEFVPVGDGVVCKYTCWKHEPWTLISAKLHLRDEPTNGRTNGQTPEIEFGAS